MGRQSRAAAILAIAIMLAAWTPALAMGSTWSKPRLPFGPATCSSVSATFDAAGRYHLAASCGGSIRYAVSDGRGLLTTKLFSQGPEDVDLYPQIAVDGNFVYVAYVREIQCCAGACDDGLESVGVYYRRRSLPDGSWSANRRIGLPRAFLGSFAVSGGVIHATTMDPSGGQTSYEMLVRGVVNRFPIPGASWTAIAVGSDGRLRVAYPMAGSIRYGLFNGSGFWRTRVTGSSDGLDPALALDGDDRAYVLWTIEGPVACGIEEVPSTRDGTYFATNASGTWLSGRLTTDFGAASLTVDRRTGRVHALIASEGGLTYYTRSAAGNWSHTEIGPKPAYSPVITQDPTTGGLLVAYISESRVSVLTGP